MTCPACDHALVNPYTGEYRANCRGCEVRSVSNAPLEIRVRYYRSLPADEQEQFKADVAAEFRRRKLLAAKA